MHIRHLFTRPAYAAALLAVVALSSCSDGSATGTQTGHLSIKLTDAPGDVVQAVVTIDEIYLQGSGADDAGRVVLRDDPVTVDLLTLANATTDLVDDAVVPNGRYAQLRFVVSGAYIEVENADGSTSIYASSADYPGLPAGAAVAGALQMPSLAQSGLKVNLPGGAVEVEGDQQVLLVDFDVSQSFGHAAGASGQWVMHPVLEATFYELTGSYRATLALDGAVTLPAINATPVTLADFSAVLTNGAGGRTVVALTDADQDGVFEAPFQFLTPGSFSLTFDAPSDSITFTTNPVVPAAVNVTSGGAASGAFVITAAAK